MKKTILIAPIVLLAGCFTLKQTEMPSVQFSRAPEGRDVAVAVSGFAATITTYTPVYGYQIRVAGATMAADTTAR